MTSVNYTPMLSSFIKGQVARTLNGSVEFDNLKWHFEKQKLNLELEELKILSLDKEPVFVLQDFVLLWDWRNLFNPIKGLESLGAGTFDFYAIHHQSGDWNFRNLLKSKKKSQLALEEIDIQELNLNVKDLKSKKEFNYDDLHLYYSHASSKNYVLKFASNKDDSSNNMLALDLDLNLKELKDLVELENSFDLHVSKLDGLNARFILGLLDLEPGLYQFFDKHFKNSTLSLDTKLAKTDDGKKNLVIDLFLEQFSQYPKLSFKTNIDIEEDLLFKSSKLLIGNTVVDLQGRAVDWLNKNPDLDFNVNLSRLDFYSLHSVFPELKKIFPIFILEVLRYIHERRELSGSLHLGSKFKSPRLDAKLDLENSYTRVTGEQHILESILSYHDKELTLEKFMLPLQFSRLDLAGAFDLETEDFNLDIDSKDLPLEKLRPIIIDLPLFSEQKEFLLNSFVKGYATVDMHIIGKDAKVKPEGNIKLAKTKFINSQYPIQFDDLAANLELIGDQVNIHHIQSYIEDDFVEAKGAFNLKSSELWNLEFAAPKIRAVTVQKSGLLALINPDLNLVSSSGEVKDFYLLINKAQDVEAKGRMDLEAVDLEFANDNKFHDISGSIDIHDGRINFEELVVNFAETSFLKANGSIAQDLKEPDFSLEAQDISFVQAATLLKTEEKYGLAAKGGSVDLNLTVKDRIDGNLFLDKVDFFYKGSKYAKYPFIGIEGNLILDDDLTLANSSGSFGSSSFENLLFKIENFNTDQQNSLDISLDAVLLVDELEEFIPQGISKYLKVDGNVPVNLAVKGNKLKKEINVDADLQKVTRLDFSDWLVIHPGRDIRAKVNLVATPHLVVSKDSKLIFKNQIDDIEQKVVLENSFQINDWNNPEGRSYSVDFEALESQDMDLIEPHIVSLKPLNLDVGAGKFRCDTLGHSRTRQTICDFHFEKAIARKYGIGDLSANGIDVDLLSVNDEPLQVGIKLSQGDWSGIPYKNLRFDLSSQDSVIEVTNLKGKIKDGKSTAYIKFDTESLDSEFDITGYRLPAHELAEGIWGFGAEVPEGEISGRFEGKTNGIMPDPMFYNLEGTTNLIVKNGKLSQLVTMQKILTAVNTLSNFHLNNVVQTLVTFKGGLFDQVLSSITYDKGKVSTKKLLLKAEQMELNMDGYLDYNDDQLWIHGNGLIPKNSDSILSRFGVGKMNLGNVVNLMSMNTKGNEEKRFFEFSMIGPITDMDKSVESLKANFKWLK